MEPRTENHTHEPGSLRQRLSSACLTLVVSLLPASALAQQGMPPPPVVIAKATLTELSPMVSIPGTVLSRNDARLAAEVPGRLVWVADVGTPLGLGEPAARIDDTTLQLQKREFEGLVQRERGRFTFLEPEVERLRQLAEENNAARSRLDETISDLQVAQGDLIVARARLSQIEDQLERTVIAAPFAGVVTEKLRDIGEHVSVGDEVTRLVSPQSIEVVARAPLNAVAFLSAGSTLELSNDYHAGTGAVRAIVPFGDPQSHMFEVRIDVDPEVWTVGESLRLQVPSAAPREVLAVPRDALVLRRDGALVYRISSEKTAQRVSVTVGFGDGDLIEVIGALSPGDLVVVRGAERLRPGQAVTITNPELAEASGSLAGSAGK